MRNLFTASVGALAIAACSTAVYAQETTSTIRGTVTSAGAPVAGATITVTHEPSGTTSTIVTSAGGNFSASGLRPGGPFTVKVSASGFSDYSVTDVQLTAGQPLSLPVALESAGAEIVVTAGKVKSTELSPGPITSLTRYDIAGVSSTKRDVRDLIRRDPFSTQDGSGLSGGRGIIIAGQNARLSRFSIEGLGFTDSFGLNTDGLPTVRGPVPLDSIEQISVKVAPYDVSEGNFQGGAINVILRSGGNKFHGTGFYTFNSDGLTGNRTVPSTSNPTGRVNLDFRSKTYGGFLSGPIIKDKLFFAFSYEHLQEGTPIAIGTAGFANVVPNLTDAQIANVSTIAKSVYNYDTLGVQNSTIETDEKWTAKVDWNIASNHRVVGTWIHDKSQNTFTAGFSSTSTASPILALASNNYRRPEKIDAYIGQIISDWSDVIHTELRGNYRKYDLTPVPFGEFNFAQMQVCLDPASIGDTQTCTQGSGSTPGTARIYFGPDQFRQFNYVRTQQKGADASIRADLGSITLKAIAAWSNVKVANAFVQNAFGNYYFDSLSDFQAGRASSLALNGSITGNLNDALASFQYSQATVGGQVAYDPSPDLNFTAGARADMYGGITPPPLNTFFTNRYGFSNRSVINGKMVIQPRVSATYSGINHLTLKGGIGLFAGGSPDVFLGNSYSVSGVVANAITIQRAAAGGCVGTVPAAVCTAALNGVNGRTIDPTVLAYLRTNTTALSGAAVNAMDPNYKMQSTWKANFSADYDTDFDNFLGSKWHFGGAAYYGFTNNAPLYVDLRLAQIGTAPDGRPRYASLVPGNANNDLYLTNTTKGHSLILVGSVDKTFDFGLKVGGSYTFQDITDVSPMNGTTASGTYGGAAMVDPNKAAYGRSSYEVRNSFKLSIDYAHEFFPGYETRFSLFGERRSGLPYSLTMNDNVQTLSHGNTFGASGTSNRYLLYVPVVSSMTADPLVSYDSAATFNAFSAFVTANGLKQGAIIGKNTQRSPHWTKIDLHIEQSIPVPLLSSAKVKLFADIDNLPNLINKDWGSLRQVAFPGLATVINVSCATTSGGNCTQYRYSSFQNPNIDNAGRISLYAIRIGAKVEF